mmetsp:Transcript_28673/g.72095  ORF Transcript_28673/g.72095 Transcript_28673/m.72095 type:complete len:375 (+) Transcript_28673:220-1344(+)
MGNCFHTEDKQDSRGKHTVSEYEEFLDDDKSSEDSVCDFVNQRFAPTFVVVDVTVEELRRELLSSNWVPTRDFLSKPMSSDDFDWYLDKLSHWTGKPDWLDDWIESEPESALPWLVRGCHALHWARQVRGVDSLEEVGTGLSVRSGKCFRERIQTAEHNFNTAAKLAPTLASPWTKGLLTARYLRLDMAHVWGRFRELQKRTRGSFTGCKAMLQALSWKCGGNNTDLLAFAREEAMGAEPGHLLCCLAVFAHVEIWLGLSLQDAAQSETYFTDEAVCSDVTKAWFNSLKHSAHEPGKFDNLCFNYFAFCFDKMGCYSKAVEAFESTTGVVSAYPWLYMSRLAGEVDAWSKKGKHSSALQVFTEARSRCEVRRWG